MQLLEKSAGHKCVVEMIGHASWQTVCQLASQPAGRLAGWLVGGLFAMIHFRSFPQGTCALRAFQVFAWTWKCADFNLAQIERQHHLKRCCSWPDDELPFRCCAGRRKQKQYVYEMSAPTSCIIANSLPPSQPASR